MAGGLPSSAAVLRLEAGEMGICRNARQQRAQGSPTCRENILFLFILMKNI